MVNAKYDNEPGLKAYTHVSDRFAPFATQTIPATVHKAPYILDGLLMTDARQNIRDRTAEVQSYRITGMILLAAIIIYWNTKKLGEAVAQRIEAGNPPDPALLQHASPLGWEQITLTEKYTWVLDRMLPVSRI